MPYFGDVYIPWITDKDTSISKDTVEKNFVDHPPQVYELTPDLEAGTYTAVLNETVHDKDESFVEQQDAVLSMVSRHGTEFPFSVAGDDGYVIVSSANTSIDPRQEIRDAEIDVRFLDGSDYNGCMIVNPYPFKGGSFDSEVEPHETLASFPSSINVIGKTPDLTLEGEDEDIDYYIISDRGVLEYEETDLNSQQNNICHLFNSTDERIYSESRIVDDGSTVNNSKCRVTYNDSGSQVEYYDSRGWNLLGTVNLPFGDGYPSVNENEQIDLEFVNDNSSSLYRGMPFVEYTFSGESEFVLELDTEVQVYDDTWSDYFAQWSDGNFLNIIIVKAFNEGDFFNNDPEIGIENLTPSDEHKLMVAVAPTELAMQDFARYVYNVGSRRRSFVQ